MSFVTGDIVGLYDTGGCTAASQIGTGIVTRVSQVSINVAFDDSKDGLSFDNDAVYNLLKLANDITYKRMKRCVIGHEKYKIKYMRQIQVGFETVKHFLSCFFARSALNALNAYRNGPAANLINVLFGETQPSSQSQPSKLHFII